MAYQITRTIVVATCSMQTIVSSSTRSARRQHPRRRIDFNAVERRRHLAESSVPRRPGPPGLGDLVLRACNEVPPHEEPFIERHTPDQHRAARLRAAESALVGSDTEVRELSGSNGRRTDAHLTVRHDECVLKRRVKANGRVATVE